MYAGSPSPSSASASDFDTHPATSLINHCPSRMQRPARRDRPRTHAISEVFHKAHDFVIRDSVVGSVTYNSETFMERFEKHTIPGAEFDSSDRDPPPRCHPGTRLSIVERAQEFLTGYRDGKRLFWLVGPAGVGKSAIMQTLAENASSPTSDVALGASLFFSINGRSDASKAIPTLAYQIAVNHHPYRQFIHDKMIDDPKLPSKSIQKQFRTFFIEPFAEHAIYRGPKPLLIIIDGLDECIEHEKQCELVSLISYFSLVYPDALLTWVIASRPEPHLTHAFSRPSVALSLVKEEILVDDDKARADVECYLRDELEKIRAKSPALMRSTRWPAERDFLKLSAAADGLFAYASAAVRFIDDPAYGNPVTQLKLLLEVIDDTLARLGENRTHPMANLDALYSRILSRIPPDVLKDTKKLLLLAMGGVDEWEIRPMAHVCDWLAMTPDVAYGALHHLHSVLNIPAPDAAERHKIAFFHKSFRDYLSDFARSGVFEDVPHEVIELNFQCAIRILREVLKARETDMEPSAPISLYWAYQGTPETDERCKLYGGALRTALDDLEKLGHQSSDVICTMRAIDIQLCLVWWENVVPELCDFLLNDCRVTDLKKFNVLQDMPLGVLSKDNIDVGAQMYILLHTQNADLVSDHVHLCDSICCECYSDGRDEHHTLSVFVNKSKCMWWKQVFQEFEHGKIHSPEHLVTTFSDIQGNGWVLYKFVDQEDKSGQWEYCIPYIFK